MYRHARKNSQIFHHNICIGPEIVTSVDFNPVDSTHKPFSIKLENSEVVNMKIAVFLVAIMVMCICPGWEHIIVFLLLLSIEHFRKDLRRKRSCFRGAEASQGLPLSKGTLLLTLFISLYDFSFRVSMALCVPMGVSKAPAPMGSGNLK